MDIKVIVDFEPEVKNLLREFVNLAGVSVNASEAINKSNKLLSEEEAPKKTPVKRTTKKSFDPNEDEDEDNSDEDDDSDEDDSDEVAPTLEFLKQEFTKKTKANKANVEKLRAVLAGHGAKTLDTLKSKYYAAVNAEIKKIK